MKPLTQIILEACCEGEDITFHTNYSGRGMFGKTCVALSGGESQVNEILGIVYKEILQAIFDAALDGDEETANNHMSTAHEYIDLLSNRAWDNLGHQIVYYWPRIKGEI